MIVRNTRPCIRKPSNGVLPARPEAFTGAFVDKPGVVTLDAGESQTYAMSLTFGAMI